jgi:large subunit ribosomal protein L9
MKVILLKSVPKLGKVNDIVEVPDGYASNALFPKRLAKPATASAVAQVKTELKNKATNKQIQHALLDKAIESLENKTLIFKAKANEKGSLFSKIDINDIAAELLKQHRISIDPKIMHVAESSIKHTGIYTVSVKDGEYSATFNVEVIPA